MPASITTTSVVSVPSHCYANGIYDPTLDMDACDYFGGIEGGATKTKMMLVKRDGEVVGESSGDSTNYWLIGLEECVRRLSQLVVECKTAAGIDANTPLRGLGMSLSGVESEECKVKLEREFRKKFPSTSSSYILTSDTTGSIATGCEDGGIVIISGTGSNCELVNPDGLRHRAGGWGHMMGDEGSAYWISHYCMKQVFDDEDNLVKSPHDISTIKNIIFKHFNVKNLQGLLEHIYAKFDKAFTASMTVKIANAARNEKDGLCCAAFHQAGFQLGNHLRALAEKIDPVLLAKPGGLHVVCIGSVWKSFDLLKEGFLEGVRPRKDGDIVMGELSLLTLTKPVTWGAANLSAKSTGHVLPADYSTHAEVFFHHKI